MKKKVTAFCLTFTIIFCLIASNTVMAEAYPFCYMAGNNGVLKTHYNVGDNIELDFTYCSYFNNEKIIIDIYDSYGNKVAGASTQVYNQNFGFKKYTVTWDTAGYAPGEYRIVTSMEFYSLYRWNEAPSTYEYKFTLSSAGGSYSDPTSDLLTAWEKHNGYWYYIYNGVVQKGWTKVSGKWYYLGTDGAMQTGWQKISGKWYYLNSSGVMQTGWQKISGKWYYFASGGAMQTGWQKVSGKWYYFASGGAMQTSWQKISGKWYYFASGGAMQTGWQKIGGKWYYFASGGAMQTGWQKIGNKWYYFETNGSMVIGTQKIGSKTYTFDSNGVWIK